MVSVGFERQQREEGKVNWFQRLSLHCMVGEEEEGREREDSVNKRERRQEGRSRARRRERERERGPALTAHIAGWLAGSLTVDE